jgi:hypothetical protein
MTTRWRPLVLAAALNATIAGMVSAQTVIVRGVPAGTPIELVVNADVAGSAAADAAGDARLTTNMFTAPGKTQTDAYLYFDTCKETRRILLAERAVQPPPPQSGCDRRQILGLFLVRRVTTLVVDATGANPTVLVRQGSVNLTAARPWTPGPTGLMVFGGGGLTEIRDATRLACGAVSPCTSDPSGWGFTAGANYWFTRHLGAEFSFVKTSEFTAQGDGGTFRFDSFFDAQVYNISGMIGVPAGRMRFYGKVGTNYHRATSATSQDIDDVTIVGEDGTETVIEGGTQTFSLETAGWGWQFGGGGELWFGPRVALYGDLGWTWLKGSGLDDADGEIDDRATVAMIGIRIRLGL